MDEITAFLPPPFNLFHMAWGMLYLVWYCTAYQIFQLMFKISTRGKKKEKCPMVSKETARERLDYVVLILTLIERLLEAGFIFAHNFFGII